jgi:serine/threonine protein kinase
MLSLVFETRMETFGPYQLVKRLATGGMGELFLAIRPGTTGFAKFFVLKRIRKDLADSEEFRQSFLHEGHVAALIDHPNVVHVYDLGEIDGAYYMTMEHVSGNDLQSLLEAVEGPLELSTALHVLDRLCEGVGYAHDAQGPDGTPLKLVHRDINPRNVLLGFSGAVKLTDFGIAKVRMEHREQTRTGVIKGKLGYLAPEQAMGKGVDHRSDIYSLGLLLFEMTTGEQAVRGETEREKLFAALDGLIHRPTELLPDYPAGLEEIYLKATAKELSQRYQSVAEMQEQLQAFRMEHRLVVGAAPLAQLMRLCFAEQLEQQRAVAKELLGNASRVSSSTLLGLSDVPPVRKDPSEVPLPKAPPRSEQAPPPERKAPPPERKAPPPERKAPPRPTPTAPSNRQRTKSEPDRLIIPLGQLGEMVPDEVDDEAPTGMWDPMGQPVRPRRRLQSTPPTAAPAPQPAPAPEPDTDVSSPTLLDSPTVAEGATPAPPSEESDGGTPTPAEWPSDQETATDQGAETLAQEPTTDPEGGPLAPEPITVPGAEGEVEVEGRAREDSTLVSSGFVATSLLDDEPAPEKEKPVSRRAKKRAGQPNGDPAAFARLERLLMEELEHKERHRKRRSWGVVVGVSVLVIALAAGAGLLVRLMRDRMATDTDATRVALRSDGPIRPVGGPVVVQLPKADAAVPAPDQRPAASAPQDSGVTAAAKPADRGVTAAAEPADTAGRLRLTVIPPVTVTLRGRELGRTPLTTELPAGAHYLLLTEPRLGIRIRRGVRIDAGELSVIEWRLKKGALELAAEPPAEVQVDGMNHGTTPLKILLYEGTHDVRLTGPQPGQTFSRRVRLEPEKTVRVSHTFAAPSTGDQ